MVAISRHWVKLVAKSEGQREVRENSIEEKLTRCEWRVKSMLMTRKSGWPFSFCSDEVQIDFSRLLGYIAALRFSAISP
jgi:hypothetical protein